MDEPVSLSLYYEGDLKSGEFKVERMKLSLVSPLSSTDRDGTTYKYQGLLWGKDWIPKERARLIGFYY